MHVITYVCTHEYYVHTSGGKVQGFREGECGHRFQDMAVKLITYYYMYFLEFACMENTAQSEC